MVFDLIEQAERGRIDELEEKVVRARDDYYNGQASVADDVYDAWIDELAELKAESTAVTAIGAPPASAWPKVEHSIPMGSLEKVQTLDEMTNWIQERSRHGRPEPLLVTEKLDGISVSLTYVEGKLVQALTRGDGLIGEDITPNVAKMKGVLHQLPELVNVVFRGEIVLLLEDHKRHFPDKNAPRNIASGTAKRLDGKGCEHLTVMLYRALDGPEFTRAHEELEYIKRLGLLHPRFYQSAVVPGVKTPHDLWVDYTSYIRDSLAYEIDGLVVSFDDLAFQWSLGENHGRPKGATAFKFAAITRETVVLDRVDQVGGTGRITPVAVFRPIRILGAEISRASLYNQRYVEQIGFDVGAKILVSRANDVIPRVVSVSGKTGSVSQAPTHCPECGAETERDGEYVICPNVGGCPAQTEGRIKTWIQKQGILEWGPGLIEKVVSAGLVKSVPDLYRLSHNQIADLDRMGESSAKNALAELWKVVPMPLEMFLGSLGIPLCGRSTMTVVVDAGYDTLDKIVMMANVASLMSIPGLGPKRARALRKWLDENDALLEDLLDVGVKIKPRTVGALTGKSVCFTGKSNLKRSELEKLASNAGGTVKKSVGKGLTFLVLADPNSTTTKAKAARKNGTECISEDDFLERVGYDGG